MASLRSLIVGGRVITPNLPPEQVQNTREYLARPDAVLVNAQTVYENVHQAVTGGEVSFHLDDLKQIPRPKPPFETMWIESLQSWPDGRPCRTGILVQRHMAPPDWNPSREGNKEGLSTVLEHYRTDQPTDIVGGWMWQESNGSAWCPGLICYWLDGEGNFQFSFVCPGVPDKHYRGAQEVLECQQIWLLHTMARLNCHNVELRPMTAAHGKIERSRKAPCSVWREIVVKPSTVAGRARTADPVQAEKHAVRLHKVRGHYADYRTGSGLFGKWKVLIWVDEHESGEAESGTVISSYRVI